MKIKKSGFSMIEVALALGVISIAMVGIFALLGVGLDATRDSNDDNKAAILVQAVVADRRVTPFDQVSPPISRFTFGIPALTDSSRYPYTLYFKKEAGGTAPTTDPLQRAYYEVSMNVNTNHPAGVLRSPDLALFDIRVSWPASQPMGNRATYYYSTAIARR